MRYVLKPLAQMVEEGDDFTNPRVMLRIGDELWPAAHIDALEVAIDINKAHEASLAKLAAYADTLETLLERAIEERRCDHAAEPCSWCGPVKAALGYDE